MNQLIIWLLIGATGGLLVNVASPYAFHAIWWLDVAILSAVAILTGLVVFIALVYVGWTPPDTWSYVLAGLLVLIVGLDEHGRRTGDY